MKFSRKYTLMVLFLTLSLLFTACAQQNAHPPEGDNFGSQSTPTPHQSPSDINQQQQGFRLQGNEQNGVGSGEPTPSGAEDAEGQRAFSVVVDNMDSVTISGIEQDGQSYVPLSELFQFLGFEVRTEENRFQAGFTGVLYDIELNSNQAMVEDEQVTLEQNVIDRNNEAYASVQSLDQILGNVFQVEIADDTISITSVEEDYGFQDNEDLGDIEVDEEEDMPAVSPAVADNIIRTARRFIGTPYVFGAASGVTSRFDCSSYTQYVYYQNGIRLNRTARAQARQGTFVPVSQLRRGDLLFFAWPGRFSSDRIVGHVGIYGGNGYMIHTIPNRGVHIVNAARSSYWRANYLGAKRMG